MADITKCDNFECPIKETCYRHTAKDGGWQSYAHFQYEKNGHTILCHNFINNAIKGEK